MLWAHQLKQDNLKVFNIKGKEIHVTDAGSMLLTSEKTPQWNEQAFKLLHYPYPKC